MSDHIAEIDRVYRAYVAHHRAGDRGSGWSYKVEGRRLWDAVSDAKAQAAAAFAALNGWKRDERTAYDPEAIGRRNRRYLDTSGYWSGPRFFDHCINFRADGKNVAVVTQPYAYSHTDAAERWAAERGLAIHLPPDPRASIHYPGATFFIVFVAAGEVVNWLPDQDGRLADRWAAAA
jgi:hypothetical protein